MRIAPDKWKHIFVGVAMGICFPLVFTWALATPPLISAGISFSLVVLIGFAFEFYSGITGHGHYDPMDGVATVVGGVLALVGYLLITL